MSALNRAVSFGREGRVLVASPRKEFRAKVLSFLAPGAVPAMEASGGAEALLKLEENDVRTVVVDRDLPDLDLKELLETIRARFPELNVVVPDQEKAADDMARSPIAKAAWAHWGHIADTKSEVSERPAGKIDDAQRERLLLDHLPQVQYIARRVHDRVPRQVLLEDLVHAGILGLLDAVRKYDPSKNVELKHYAEFRIRGAILDSLRAADWSPRKLRRQARRLDRAILDCRARLGRDPSESEVAAELQMSLADLQQLRGDVRRLEIGNLSWESREAADSDAIEACAGPERNDPYHQTLQVEMTTLLEQAMGELSERERDVLVLYHFKELTMREVGALLGIGDSRVSQIHTDAIQRLRVTMRERLDGSARQQGQRVDAAAGLEDKAGAEVLISRNESGSSSESVSGVRAGNNDLKTSN